MIAGPISPGAPAAPPDDRLSSRIGRLAKSIHGDAVAASDRAAFKRWAPGQPIPIAFYRVWLRFAADDLPEEEQATPWMALAWGIAVMGPHGHRPGQRFGAALARAGYAQARLERLLDAPSDVLPDLFSTTVRHLASKAEGFDWTDAAELLLARSLPARESIRRRIAIAYYRPPVQE